MLTLRDCFVIATLLAVSLALSRVEVGEIGMLILFMPAAYAAWQFLRRRRMIPHPVARNLIISLAGATSSALLLLLIDRGRLHADPRLANSPDRLYMWLVLYGIMIWGAMGGGIMGIIADLVVLDSRLENDS